MRGKGNKVQYLVAWKGLDPGTGEKYCDSWEPASGLKASEWAVEQFKNKIANEIPIKKRASSSCASSNSGASSSSSCVSSSSGASSIGASNSVPAEMAPAAALPAPVQNRQERYNQLKGKEPEASSNRLMALWDQALQETASQISRKRNR